MPDYHSVESILGIFHKLYIKTSQPSHRLVTLLSVGVGFVRICFLDFVEVVFILFFYSLSPERRNLILGFFSILKTIVSYR